MSDTPLFAVTPEPLELTRVVAAIEAQAATGAGPGAHGAVTSFLGLVRASNLNRRVLRLEYEAYAPLALKAFTRIDDEARREWPGVRLAIHHRTGVLLPGDPSVVIVAASAHRGEAFAGCRFAIERIKQIAPIWKREFFEGGDVWIEGATVDPDDALAREEARRRACA